MRMRRSSYERFRRRERRHNRTEHRASIPSSVESGYYRVILRSHEQATTRVPGVRSAAFAGGVLQAVIFAACHISLRIMSDAEAEATSPFVFLAASLAAGPIVFLSGVVIGSDMFRNGGYGNLHPIRAVILFATTMAVALTVFIYGRDILPWLIGNLRGSRPYIVTVPLGLAPVFFLLSLPGPLLAGWLLARTRPAGLKDEKTGNRSVASLPHGEAP